MVSTWGEVMDWVVWVGEPLCSSDVWNHGLAEPLLSSLHVPSVEAVSKDPGLLYTQAAPPPSTSLSMTEASTRTGAAGTWSI